MYSFQFCIIGDEASANRESSSRGPYQIRARTGFDPDQQKNHSFSGSQLMIKPTLEFAYLAKASSGYSLAWHGMARAGGVQNFSQIQNFQGGDDITILHFVTPNWSSRALLNSNAHVWENLEQAGLKSITLWDEPTNILKYPKIFFFQYLALFWIFFSIFCDFLGIFFNILRFLGYFFQYFAIFRVFFFKILVIFFSWLYDFLLLWHSIMYWIFWVL